MAHFFFHVRDDGDLSWDAEGQEFADLEAARLEAMNSNREILGERLLHGGTLDHYRIEIANDQGEVLAVVNARDTLFQEGHLRSFDDDVTKSAPTASLKAIPAKPVAR